MHTERPVRVVVGTVSAEGHYLYRVATLTQRGGHRWYVARRATCIRREDSRDNQDLGAHPVNHGPGVARSRCCLRRHDDLAPMCTDCPGQPVPAPDRWRGELRHAWA